MEAVAVLEAGVAAVLEAVAVLAVAETAVVHYLHRRSQATRQGIVAARAG